MKFTVEDAKSAQAIAYVQAELFREYSLQQDGSMAMFRVNLTVLMVSTCMSAPHADTCTLTCTYTHMHIHMHISTLIWCVMLVIDSLM